MHILEILVYFIGSCVVITALIWGVSQITASALMAYYDWKDRR